MRSDISTPRIAIIGAGLTGLLAAQGLKNAGLPATVFERDPSLMARPRDWSILIHWALPILHSLLTPAVRAAIETVVCNPHVPPGPVSECLPIFSGRSGRLMFSSPTPGARRISRQRLRQVLAEGLNVRWGKSLMSVEEGSDGMRLLFADGERVEVDYILGADGLWSAVRRALLGEKRARPFGSGFVMVNGVVRYGDAEKTRAVTDVHPVAALMMGSNAVAACGVLYTDDLDDMATWTVFWTNMWKGSAVTLDGAEAIRYARNKLDGLCEPFRSVINWTPENGATCSISEMKCWVPVPWNNHGGRVTLVGDAAHPMLVFRGQGLQHAMLDVRKYVDAMVQLTGSHDAAFRERVMTEFDGEIIERGSKAVRQALEEAEKSLDMSTVGQMLMLTQGHIRSA